MALPVSDRRSLGPRVRVVIIVLLLLGAASLVGDRGLVRLFQMHRTKAALMREIAQLTVTNATLAEEVHALRTDSSQVEAIAREELGLVKPGETVYEFRSAAPLAGPVKAK